MTTLSQQMKQQALPFIDRIYNEPFIQDMIKGTLSKEACVHYLQADYRYLKEFANIYAILLAKVDNLKYKQFFLKQIDFVMNHEIDAHKVLADYVGRPYEEIVAEGEWYPTADHYIKHMYYNVLSQGVAETLGAMAPCPWVYRLVAKKINENHVIPDNHPFKQWIDFYDAPFIEDIMVVYDEMVDAYMTFASDKQKQVVLRNFLQSCEHEKNFFNMAYTQEKWLGV